MPANLPFRNQIIALAESLGIHSGKYNQFQKLCAFIAWDRMQGPPPDFPFFDTRVDGSRPIINKAVAQNYLTWMIRADNDISDNKRTVCDEGSLGTVNLYIGEQNENDLKIFMLSQGIKEGEPLSEWSPEMQAVVLQSICWQWLHVENLNLIGMELRSLDTRIDVSEHVIKQKEEFSTLKNCNFSETTFDGAKLSGILIDNGNLREASLQRTDIDFTSFTGGTDATGARFINAKMSYVRLGPGIFELTDFSNTKMDNALLCAADFPRTNFLNASLKINFLRLVELDISGANFQGTNITLTDKFCKTLMSWSLDIWDYHSNDQSLSTNPLTFIESIDDQYSVMKVNLIKSIIQKFDKSPDCQSWLTSDKAVCTGVLTVIMNVFDSEKVGESLPEDISHFIVRRLHPAIDLCKESRFPSLNNHGLIKGKAWIDKKFPDLANNIEEYTSIEQENTIASTRQEAAVLSPEKPNFEEIQKYADCLRYFLKFPYQTPSERTKEMDARLLPWMIQLQNNQPGKQPIRYSDTKEDFIQNLKQHLSDESTPETKYVACIPINNPGSSQHYIAVEYRKVNNKHSMICFDPILGGEFGTDRLKEFIAYIAKALRKLCIFPVQLDIQKGPTGCRMFSLSTAIDMHQEDVAMLALHQYNVENFTPKTYTEMAESKILGGSDVDKYIPPRFLRHAQSLQRINNYLSNNNPCVNMSINQQGDTLQEYAKEYTSEIFLNIKLKKINRSIEAYRLQQVENILVSIQLGDV